jgi:tRNA A-37 threonylcarbamoyl transferase component Bud32
LPECMYGKRLHYIAMQYIDGQPLQAHIQDSVYLAACNSLDSLHILGVQHNDLKLENMLVCGQRVMFYDFDKSIIDGPPSDIETEKVRLLGR